MLDWSKISTVLLDMDGTILDLHFDNHFWLTHIPKRYSEKNGISIEQTKQELLSHYQRVEGTIDWYCLDYWATQLNLPIRELKREVEHLIELREDAHDFLVALKKSGREIILVTNAHPDSLSLKIEHTSLDQYFDQLYSTHTFGETKESQGLWAKLRNTVGFDNKHTLFVDDSTTILSSAQQFGIEHLLAVANPDSKQSTRTIAHFPSITDFRTLIDDIMANPVN